MILIKITDDPGIVSLGYGDAHEIVLIACAGVHRHSCLAKEDPDY